MKSPVVDPFDPFTRFSTSVKSVEDITYWAKTHKSDTDVIAVISRFEERTKHLYDLEYSRNEAWHTYAQTAYAIQTQKEDFDQQMSALRRDYYSEDHQEHIHSKEQASKEQASKEQASEKQTSKELFSKEQASKEQASKMQASKLQASKLQASKEHERITSQAAKADDLKTVILALYQKGDLEQVGAALLLYNPITHPIAVQSRGQTQLTLQPSDSIFRFSAIKRDGMLEDLEEGEDDDPKEDGHAKRRSWSDITLTIDPPYWLLYRDEYQGPVFFVAPKTKAKRVKSQDAQEKIWVREESAGDNFLQLGWLAEKKNNDGPEQMTRYIVALNLSTNPLSMWLIYDYRQPDALGHLHTANVPAIGEPDLYMDPVSEAAIGKGKEEAPEKKHNGYLDQLEPWDLACLYPDAPKDWPKDASSAAAAAAGATHPPILLRYGPPNQNLRAKRSELTAI